MNNREGSQFDKGYIYIASLKKRYYHLAVYSATTLKDFYPDANITLFTHEKFLDNKADIFDTVITDIPIYYRTKMWGMANTPYKKTIYIDADSAIVNKDISILFNDLDDCDMFFGPVAWYTPGNIAWAYMDKAMTIRPKYHGAVCGYNKTDLTIDFMNTWYEDYIKQRSTPWPHTKYDSKWQIFDMFTLWRMTCGRFEEYERFNKLHIKMMPPGVTFTAQHSTEDKLLCKPIIQLIDVPTFRRVEWFKKIIAKEDHNAIFTDKEYPASKPPTEFN